MRIAILRMLRPSPILKLRELIGGVGGFKGKIDVGLSRNRDIFNGLPTVCRGRTRDWILPLR